MRDDKRKRLEAKGWRVGSAKQLLGLTPDEDIYVEIRLQLVDTLRRERARMKMTQSALAQKVRSSQSRVAKMEAGDPSVSLDLLVRTLLSLGVSRRRVGSVIAGRSIAA